MAAIAVLPQRPMITPEEQLRLLALPTVEERLHNKGGAEALPSKIVDVVIESAIRSILKPMADEDIKEEAPKERVPSLTDIVTDRVVERLGPLPSILTHWYTALGRIHALPDKIPALPRNIHQILGSKCPIFSTDKTPYKIGETHLLYLIPEELGSINRMVGVFRAYGAAHYPTGENPFRLSHVWHAIRQQLGDCLVEPTHWVLMTNDVLPGSRKKSYKEQDDIIDSLSQKAFVDYEMFPLRDAVAALFLHKIATGESLCQSANEQNGHIFTFTRVKKTSRGLMVGNFGSHGLGITASASNYYGIGVLACGSFKALQGSGF